MTKVNGISEEANKVADKMVIMIEEGDITMHILTNTSLERKGDIEHEEMLKYQGFLKSRLGYEIMNLNGSGMYEKY